MPNSGESGRSASHTPRTSSTSTTSSPAITPSPLPPVAEDSRIPSNAPPSTPRKDRHRKVLSASMTPAPETPRHRRTTSAVDDGALRDAREKARDPYTVVQELRSIRSSAHRRRRALRDLECALAAACTGDEEDMEAFVALQAHIPLLSLLGRHTASLAKRASTTSLPPNDEVARHIGPEIEAALSILQGLALISRACKAAVGEQWAMEMFLDMLLLLRTQPPLGTSPPTVDAVLDLLFCVLVDSPEHVRVFEDLQGLEAVTRVLRGTGVSKAVRMKCIEFLGFYLLPEGATSLPDSYNLSGLPGSRSTSSSSISSGAGSGFISAEMSSASFVGHDVTQPAIQSPAHSRVSSVDVARPASPERHRDLADLPFVPQTPRKPPKPSLGFQTPAKRRTSPSTSMTTSTPLTPVAQSPDEGKRHQRPLQSGDETPSDTGSRTSSGSSSGGSISTVTRHKREPSVGTPLASGTPQPRETSAALGRRPSVKRSGKSPLAQLSTPEATDSPRRHMRSQSATSMVPPVTPARDRQRSRGFPAELTRGALPGSGASTPLSPSRRLPSQPNKGSIRSPQEKKEMLGMWIGNVDQLVESVEKVGFWARKRDASVVER